MIALSECEQGRFHVHGVLGGDDGCFGELAFGKQSFI